MPKREQTKAETERLVAFCEELQKATVRFLGYDPVLLMKGHVRAIPADITEVQLALNALGNIAANLIACTRDNADSIYAQFGVNLGQTIHEFKKLREDDDTTYSTH